MNRMYVLAVILAVFLIWAVACPARAADPQARARAAVAVAVALRQAAPAPAPAPAPAKVCDCSPECTCGCQDGQPCTCPRGPAAAVRPAPLQVMAAPAVFHLAPQVPVFTPQVYTQPAVSPIGVPRAAASC